MGVFDSLRFVFSDLSFLLSFAGVAGLVLLSKPFGTSWSGKLGLPPTLSAMLAKYGDYFVFALAAMALTSLAARALRLFIIRADGLKTTAGNIGASDRKLVQRGLSAYLIDWSPGTRESFLHQLGRLAELGPESRQSAARSIARDFARGRPSEELSLLLSLFASLSEFEQVDVVYSLREVQPRVIKA